MLDISQQISSCYLSSWSSLILGVPLSTPHQLWQDRPSASCTGSFTTWRDVIRNWLPFRLTWTLWAPAPTWFPQCTNNKAHELLRQVTPTWLPNQWETRFTSLITRALFCFDQLWLQMLSGLVVHCVFTGRGNICYEPFSRCVVERELHGHALL